MPRRFWLRIPFSFRPERKHSFRPPPKRPKAERRGESAAWLFHYTGNVGRGSGSWGFEREIRLEEGKISERIQRRLRCQVPAPGVADLPRPDAAEDAQAQEERRARRGLPFR